MGQPPRHLPADRHAGHGIVVANLFLLLAVSFLPLPAKILGEQLGHHGADQTAAMIFYNACFVAVAGFFNLVWLLACRAGRFVPGSKDAVARITSRYRLGVPSYLVATVVAVWSVPREPRHRRRPGPALHRPPRRGRRLADQAPAGA